MAKFEHAIVTLTCGAGSDFDPNFAPFLTEMEARGWAIVTAYAVPDFSIELFHHHYVFRRDVGPTKRRTTDDASPQVLLENMLKQATP